jgi:hypothetical protein
MYKFVYQALSPFDMLRLTILRVTTLGRFLVSPWQLRTLLINPELLFFFRPQRRVNIPQAVGSERVWEK